MKEIAAQAPRKLDQKTINLANKVMKEINSLMVQRNNLKFYRTIYQKDFNNNLKVPNLNNCNWQGHEVDNCWKSV